MFSRMNLCPLLYEVLIEDEDSASSTPCSLKDVYSGCAVKENKPHEIKRRLSHQIFTDEKEVVPTKKLLNDGGDSGFVSDSGEEDSVLVSRKRGVR